MNGMTMTEISASRQSRKRMAMKLIRNRKRILLLATTSTAKNLPHRVHVGRHPLDEVARVGAVMVREGQSLDMVEQIVAQALDDAL